MRLRLFEIGCARLTRGAGVVSGTFIVVMMLVIVANVTGRFLFNTSFLGSIELTRTLLVIVVFFGLSYTQLHKAHIRVDIVFLRASAKLQRILETFGLFVALVVYGAITYAALPVLYHSLIIREYETGAMPFPVWPARLALSIGLIILVFQLVADIRTELLKGKQ